MSDAEALLRAIRLHPEADAPRLIFADWLDEHAGSVRRCSGTHSHSGKRVPLISGGFRWDAHGVLHCDDPRKPHHHCDEKCTVSDGRAELAELIRVQVELARHTHGWKPENLKCVDIYLDPQNDESQRWKHKLHEMQARESALLAQHGREWARVPWAGGDAFYAFSDQGQATPHFARGFVSRVEVPSLSWVMERVAAKCNRCGGKGWYSFRGAEFGYEEEWCAECNRTGTVQVWRVTDWALAVARVHPVQRWECADREPHLNIGGYRWYDEDQHYTLDEDGQRAELPNLVLKAIAARSKFVSFDTPDQARVALARALGDAVRAAAEVQP
mgnify:CR=1 FL=1